MGDPSSTFLNFALKIFPAALLLIPYFAFVRRLIRSGEKVELSAFAPHNLKQPSFGTLLSAAAPYANWPRWLLLLMGVILAPSALLLVATTVFIIQDALGGHLPSVDAIFGLLMSYIVATLMFWMIGASLLAKREIRRKD